jgi:molybdate transport system substrate-binding protein
MLRFVQLVTAAALIAGVLQPPHASAQDTHLTVFAAASLKNALDDVDAAFTEVTGIKVTVSYESSSTLVKQIDQGAPADVFISADLQWMDYPRCPRLTRLRSAKALISPSSLVTAASRWPT